MSFSEFKGRKWEVLKDPPPDPTAKHTEGNIVTFEEADGKVIVKCERYGAGQYDADKNQIIGDNYTITMEKGPNGKDQIVFAPSSKDPGPVGGSWTAEDMSNQPGGDE